MLLLVLGCIFTKKDFLIKNKITVYVYGVLRMCLLTLCMSDAGRGRKRASEFPRTRVTHVVNCYVGAGT